MTSQQAETAFKTDPVTGGTWTFYDNYAAFPFNSQIQRAERVVAEINISLKSAADGGTHGEFAVRWHRWDRFSDAAPARLEAFGDSWEVLARSGITDILAANPEMLPDQLIAALEAAGYKNITAELAVGPHPCPTCGTEGFEGTDEVLDWRRRAAQRTDGSA